MKFNVGCGWRNFGKDWIHVDAGDYEHLQSTDIYLNDYEDGCADVIYASHIIEYFDRDEIKELLQSWERVLKSDGVLRIAVPNFSVIVSLYIKGYEPYELEDFLGPLYGKMRMGKDTIYHKTVYDFNSLKKTLENVGFKDVSHYDWRETEHSEFDDHSQAYLPHMDKENGTLISLNVECVK
jgi:predicted SAM-dependent methyltransferase